MHLGTDKNKIPTTWNNYGITYSSTRVLSGIVLSIKYLGM